MGVDAGSGGIDLRDVDADDLKIDTGLRGVRFSNVSGRNCQGMRPSLRTTPRNLRVESGSGGVTVSMPESANADVDMQPGSGRIQSNFSISSSRVERNHVRGRIGNDSGRIVIESGSGTVNLRRSS